MKSRQPSTNPPTLRLTSINKGSRRAGKVQRKLPCELLIRSQTAVHRLAEPGRQLVLHPGFIGAAATALIQVVSGQLRRAPAPWCDTQE